jgi:tripartite-type tricarboxylate transporter receptor subunit TctC
MMRHFDLSPVYGAIALTVVANPAHTEEFYRGKTLSVIVGYAPGGGYDVNARLLSRHLGKHLPGQPSVVVVSMPGAGSLKMLEYINQSAPKDGTAIGLFDFTQITNSLLMPEMVKVDFRRFSWIGSLAQDLAVCYVSNRIGAKSLADVQRLGSLPMGRTNPGSSSDIEQKIFRKMFDVHVQSVAGYAGSSEAFLALERGELDGGCLTWSSLPSNWISEHKITPILKMSPATAPDLPADVPNAEALLPNDKDRQVLGVLTEASKLGKPFIASQRVPDIRIGELRQAFDETLKDPEFLADAEKLRQPVSAVEGLAAQAILDRLYATRPDVIDAAKRIAADD